MTNVATTTCILITGYDRTGALMLSAVGTADDRKNDCYARALCAFTRHAASLGKSIARTHVIRL